MTFTADEHTGKTGGNQKSSLSGSYVASEDRHEGEARVDEEDRVANEPALFLHRQAGHEHERGTVCTPDDEHERDHVAHESAGEAE